MLIYFKTKYSLILIVLNNSRRHYMSKQQIYYSTSAACDLLFHNRLQFVIAPEELYKTPWVVQCYFPWSAQHSNQVLTFIKKKSLVDA